LSSASTYSWLVLATMLPGSKFGLGDLAAGARDAALPLTMERILTMTG
jgi:hypothetical protein